MGGYQSLKSKDRDLITVAFVKENLSEYADLSDIKSLSVYNQIKKKKRQNSLVSIRGEISDERSVDSQFEFWEIDEGIDEHGWIRFR